MNKKPVTRRDFIKGAGFAVGATVLSACGAATPVVQTQVVEKVVKETTVVKEVVKETSS